jgi:predicted nucleotidyltransferase
MGLRDANHYNERVTREGLIRRPVIARDSVQEALVDVVSMEPAVVAAYLFGSVARGSAGPLSDVDIALLVPDRRQRQTVCDRVTDALCRRLRTSRIDVISLADAPAALRYRVVRDGWLVVRRDAAAVQRFVADTVLQYLDFKPLRDRAFARMSRGILEGR